MLILYLLVIPIEIFALVLLISLKQSSVRGSQKLILIALWATKLIYAIADITYFSLVLSRASNNGSAAVLVFCTTTLTFFYVFVVTLMAIDSFLRIYLIIKYDILWSPQMTKFTLICLLAICFLSYIPSLTVELRNPKSLGKALIYYINPTFHLAFLIVASCSYFYIIKDVLRHRKTKKRIEKHLEQNNRVVHHKYSKNRLLLLAPTLIILTKSVCGCPKFYYIIHRTRTFTTICIRHSSCDGANCFHCRCYDLYIQSECSHMIKRRNSIHPA